jgi:beta-lactam-binding protein with PASTA domain
MHAVVVVQEGKAMRRKLVVLFVAFASVFGVVACGGEEVDVKEGAKEEAEEAQEEVQEAREVEKVAEEEQKEAEEEQKEVHEEMQEEQQKKEPK